MAWCIRCVRETVVRCCFYQYGVVHTCVCTLLPARHNFSHIPSILLVNQHLFSSLSPFWEKWANLELSLSLFDPTYMVVIVPLHFLICIFTEILHTSTSTSVCADEMVCVWFALAAAHRSGGRLFCICCEERERGMHAWWEKIDDERRREIMGVL